MAEFTEIPESLYTDEMRAVSEKNKKYGVKTIFTIGDTYFRHSNDTEQSLVATVDKSIH